jgi:hypothetical protein
MKTNFGRKEEKRSLYVHPDDSHTLDYSTQSNAVFNGGKSETQMRMFSNRHT